MTGMDRLSFLPYDHGQSRVGPTLALTRGTALLHNHPTAMHTQVSGGKLLSSFVGSPTPKMRNIGPAMLVNESLGV